MIAGAEVRRLPGGVVVAWSDASRGTLRPTGHGPADGAGLASLASEVTASLVDPPAGAQDDVRLWGTDVFWATQVHESHVVVVPSTLPPAGGCHHVGTADALVTVDRSTAVAVLTADCGPLALASPEGLAAAVHVGWRGLAAGVVEATAAVLRALGASSLTGMMGPCIHPGAYPFGEEELLIVANRYGDVVRARTDDGRDALDLPAGIGAAMAAAGVESMEGPDFCTASSSRYFSHRARADAGRQAMVVVTSRVQEEWSSKEPSKEPSDRAGVQA